MGKYDLFGKGKRAKNAVRNFGNFAGEGRKDVTARQWLRRKSPPTVLREFGKRAAKEAAQSTGSEPVNVSGK